MTKTAKLYGDSLYELAVEENITEQIEKDMTRIQQIFHKNSDYLVLLSEPSVPKQNRTELLDEAFGGRIHPYLLNLLKLLCENGNLKEWSGCVKEFQIRYHADFKITEAVVTSAVPLTKKQSAALTKKLESITGKTVLLLQNIDSRVLGGLKVEVDGISLDGTAKNHLNKLRKRITEIIV